MRRVAAFLLLVGVGCAAPRSNVVVVTIDGVRWQEIFGGADLTIVDNKKETGDVAGTRKAFWRETLDERRMALAPFLWGTVAKKGALIGHVDAGSQIRVTNPYKISYPGYHELLCGFPSETIESNKKVPNPDVTVLEWLARRPGFEGSVAAFCSWDVFPSILNRERCGFYLDCGEPRADGGLLRRLSADLPPPWHGSVYDAFVFHQALAYLQEQRPRVLYLAFGDTDEWAHAGSYDHYLESIRRADGWLRELWETLQAMPGYAGTTSLLVTCDHGRGDNPGEWRSHNARVSGAGYVWVAAMGPGVAATGEWTSHDPLVQGQVAATAAALVGEDFTRSSAQVAPPLPLRKK